MFTKEFVLYILRAIICVVAVLILALVITAITKGFEETKEIYQLVVVDTLVEPFVGIIAAFVVYTFGRNIARVLHERNLMKYGKYDKASSDFETILD